MPPFMQMSRMSWEGLEEGRGLCPPKGAAPVQTLAVAIQKGGPGADISAVYFFKEGNTYSYVEAPG